MVTKDRGKGNGELLVNGDRVSVRDDEAVLGMDGGDGGTAMKSVLNATELYT